MYINIYYIHTYNIQIYTILFDLYDLLAKCRIKDYYIIMVC